MTDQRACANEEVRPVTRYENYAVGGRALARHGVHRSGEAKVKELRQRQQEYEESLPKEPPEAIKAIQQVLRDRYDDDEAEEAPRAVLLILKELLECSDEHELDKPYTEALRWLVCRGYENLDRTDNAISRIEDITNQFNAHHQPFKA